MSIHRKDLKSTPFIYISSCRLIRSSFISLLLDYIFCACVICTFAHNTRVPFKVGLHGWRTHARFYRVAGAFALLDFFEFAPRVLCVTFNAGIKDSADFEWKSLECALVCSWRIIRKMYARNEFWSIEMNVVVAYFSAENVLECSNSSADRSGCRLTSAVELKIKVEPFCRTYEWNVGVVGKFDCFP